MASRAPTTTRQSSGAARKPAAQRTPAKGKSATSKRVPSAGRSGAGRAAARRSATRRSTRSRSGSTRPAVRRSAGRIGTSLPARLLASVGILLSALFRLGVGALRLLASLAGKISRAAGSSARELDPAHRRDGLGLLLFAAALVSAGGLWWQAGGAGSAVARTLISAFGQGALVLPPLLALWAWRVLRRPAGRHPASDHRAVDVDQDADQDAARHERRSGSGGRLVVGWAALTLGALGILHILGATSPTEDKGGLVGYLLDSPLGQGMTAWLAIPLLVLLAFFGLLVVTATPIAQVPTGLRALRDAALRRPAAQIGRAHV